MKLSSCVCMLCIHRSLLGFILVQEGFFNSYFRSYVHVLGSLLTSLVEVCSHCKVVICVDLDSNHALY